MSTMLRTMNAHLPNVNNLRTSTLCSMDPVMCQEHFHKRFVDFFNNVILYSKNGIHGPLGLVNDYFWRIEVSGYLRQGF